MNKKLILIMTLFLLTNVWGACVTPADTITVVADTTLCGGTYDLNDATGNGIIYINASGVAGNPITLDCNGAIVRGNKANYGIYINNRNYIEIKGCSFTNYDTGIYSQGNYHTIQDSNFSGLGTYGIFFRISPTGHLIQRNQLTDTNYGILYYIPTLNNYRATDHNILDNNFNNNKYAIASSLSGSVNYGFDNILIAGNNFLNSTINAIILYGRGAVDTKRNYITNTNVFTGTGNGIQVNNYFDINGINLTSFLGTALTLDGSNHTVTDCNLSGKGTTGILFSDTDYNTILTRNDFTDRNTGIYFKPSTESARDHNNMILTSNLFVNNLYGLKYDRVGFAVCSFGGMIFNQNTFSNITNWGIDLYDSGASLGKSNISNNNTFSNVTNGIRVYHNWDINGIDLSTSLGTAIEFGGNNNSVVDCNLSGKGTTGILFRRTETDVNIQRNDFTDRNNGLWFYPSEVNAKTHQTFLITDNNFVNNRYALVWSPLSYETTIISGFTFNRNRFSNISEWVMYLPVKAAATAWNRVTNDNTFSNNTNGLWVWNLWDINGIDLSTTLRTAITINNSDVNVTDCNLSGRGTYGIVLTGTQSNALIKRNNFTDRNYGVEFSGGFTFTNSKILNNTFVRNITGIDDSITGNSPQVNLNISCNLFQSATSYGININDNSASITKLNSNNFINNANQIRAKPVANGSLNYWTDFNGVACNCLNATCQNSRSFTGGTDLYPSCNQIDCSCNPTINVDWNITTPLSCVDKTLDINSGKLIISAGGRLVFLNSNLITKQIQLNPLAKLGWFDTGSFIKIKGGN